MNQIATIIPDENGSIALDSVRADAYRWACEMGRLAGGHAPLVLWNDRRSQWTPLEQAEKRTLETVLSQVSGNREKAAKVAGISRSTLYLKLRKYGIACVLGVLGMLPLISSAQIKGSALLIPAMAPAELKTNRTPHLTWVSSEPKFNIYLGSARSNLVKRATISSNSYPLTAGVMGVTAVNVAGVESAPAFYPSNRVGEIVFQSSTNLSGWHDEKVAEVFTNRARLKQMYFRATDRTTGWLPPD